MATRNYTIRYSASAATASYITQYGITWTFDSSYPVGRFATGDWWVVGPVTVTAISPATVYTGGNSATIRNGSVVNPASIAAESLDGRDHDSWGRTASGLVSLPLSLDVDQSLISCKSNDGSVTTDITGAAPNLAADYGVISDLAILTCLSEAPSRNSFRPPYFGSTKTLFSSVGMATDLLPSLTAEAGAPTLATYYDYFTRPWYMAPPLWASQIFHPLNNMPSYGREVGMTISEAAVILCSDFTLAKKMPILNALVQIGIDNYHILLACPTGDTFPANGRWGWRHHPAHTMGRYFPILLAGLMLNHTGMKNVGSTMSGALFFERDMSYIGSGEDLWTGWQNGASPYKANVLTYGDAYAGEKFEQKALSAWDQTETARDQVLEAYRRLYMQAIIGQSLAAQAITGMKALWNNDAFFNACDRWVFEDDSANRTALASAANTYSWAFGTSAGDWTPFGESSLPTSWVYDMYAANRSGL